MAIDSISSTTRTLAVSTYASVQQADRQEDPRKTRQGQKQEGVEPTNSRQDQVTLSPQTAQLAGVANPSAPVQAAQSSDQVRGEDRRERNREATALSSKSVAQALTAYRETALL